MKIQQYGALQLINIVSRFVSKTLREHHRGECYSPRARLEVPRIWSRMIQKVCAVFDLCGLGLVFDGSNEPSPHHERYVSSLLYIDREARNRAASDANGIARSERVYL